jgi:hypothetical protein
MQLVLPSTASQREDGDLLAAAESLKRWAIRIARWRHIVTDLDLFTQIAHETASPTWRI